MSLTTGTQLGSYEVLSLLGRGGMGEVYRARDTKLKREVAIKTLPEEFSRDPERLARFQREAEALAALNHPNIGSIYHLQESNGSRYLVLELVEGDTLADILAKRGALAVDEAIRISKQICEALEAAHEKGITHRDLKPANIKITPDGKVKLLDFGLARAFEQPSNVNLSNSPTIAGDSTPGVIMGTAAYMSPEQAKGEVSDKRSDIWAFGCVLYEMLTGRAVFSGKTLTELLGAVIYKEMDWTGLPASTPTKVRDVLRHCLKKDRRFRLRDIGDARIELSEEQLSNVELAALDRPSSSNAASWLLRMAIVSLGLAGAILTFRYFSPRTDHFGPTKIVTFLPTGTDPNSVTISPDGTRFVYVAPNSENRQAVWVRPLDSDEAQMLQGSTDAKGPFWSPDSQWVAFFNDGKLVKAPLSGGPAVTLCDAISNGGIWGRKGVILFGTGLNTETEKVSDLGGRPDKLEMIDEQNRRLRSLPVAFRPDGEHFIFAGNPETSSVESDLYIYIGSISSTKAVRLDKVGDLYYAGPDFWLSIRRGQLVAQGLDVRNLVPSGSPQVISRVDISPYVVFPGAEIPMSAVSASDNGVLAMVASRQNHLEFFDTSGKSIGALPKPPTGEWVNPSVSPDGKLIGVNHRDPQTDEIGIWIIDTERNTVSKFTAASDIQSDPLWSPDGKSLVYRSFRHGKYGLYKRDISGGAEDLLFEHTQDLIPEDWSPDDTTVLYSNFPQAELFAVRLSDHKTLAYAKASGEQWGAKFSPDGNWVAYASTETGRAETFVQRFPPTEEKYRLSLDGGYHPVWHRNGKQIFFLDNNSNLLAVDVSVDTKGIHASKPRRLFAPRIETFFDARNHFGVMPDGRIVMRRTAADTGPLPVSIIFNWPALLTK